MEKVRNNTIVRLMKRAGTTKTTERTVEETVKVKIQIEIAATGQYTNTKKDPV